MVVQTMWHNFFFGAALTSCFGKWKGTTPYRVYLQNDERNLFLWVIFLVKLFSDTLSTRVTKGQDKLGLSDQDTKVGDPVLSLAATTR